MRSSWVVAIATGAAEHNSGNVTIGSADSETARSGHLNLVLGRGRNARGKDEEGQTGGSIYASAGGNFYSFDDVHNVFVL